MEDFLGKQSKGTPRTVGPVSYAPTNPTKKFILHIHSTWHLISRVCTTVCLIHSPSYVPRRILAQTMLIVQNHANNCRSVSRITRFTCVLVKTSCDRMVEYGCDQNKRHHIGFPYECVSFLAMIELTDWNGSWLQHAAITPTNHRAWRSYLLGINNEEPCDGHCYYSTL